MSRAKIFTLVHQFGRSLGLEIRRSNPATRPDLRLAALLKAHQIEMVLDIGANRGQFASALFQNGYAGEIVSFEALPGAHADLSRNASGYGPRWRIAPQGAMGDSDGEVEFFVNAEDATSSLLPAAQSTVDQIPGTQQRQAVTVPLFKLDSIASRYGVGTKPTFIKIDVQGGEALVLAGATKTLNNVAGLSVELSLTQLYERQPLMLDVLQPLLAAGFQIHDIDAAFRDQRTWRLQQVDVVLFRSAA